MKLTVWTWRDHYEIKDDGSVRRNVPVGWGIVLHRYRDDPLHRWEFTSWLWLIAFTLIFGGGKNG